MRRSLSYFSAASAGYLSSLIGNPRLSGYLEREEAITAVENFIRRSRLGLEPNWKVTREFARLWDSRFDTYRGWERCKRRELYRENWIEWDELRKARRTAAFSFLEEEIARYRELLGVDHFIMRCQWPGLPGREGADDPPAA